MTGRMTAADTVCCTSNEEFGGRILKHPFLHFSHSLSESISHASFRCSSRREEPSDMTLNVDFTPCHSCKLIIFDFRSDGWVPSTADRCEADIAPAARRPSWVQLHRRRARAAGRGAPGVHRYPSRESAGGLVGYALRAGGGAGVSSWQHLSCFMLCAMPRL